MIKTDGSSFIAEFAFGWKFPARFWTMVSLYGYCDSLMTCWKSTTRLEYRLKRLSFLSRRLIVLLFSNTFSIKLVSVQLCQSYGLHNFGTFIFKPGCFYGSRKSLGWDESLFDEDNLHYVNAIFSFKSLVETKLFQSASGQSTRLRQERFVSIRVLASSFVYRTAYVFFCFAQ